MWNQMKDRHFVYTPNTDHVSGFTTPLERAMSPSTPSSRIRRDGQSFTVSDGMFRNMAFAISYDEPERKNAIVRGILSHGGIVISESFLELLEPTGICPKPQYDNLGFTALLTERHSRKEKYMQALALGLPCLSGRWIESCIKHGSITEWQTFLLPAGESTELEGATRSRILPAIDLAQGTLKDLLAGRPKLFDDKSVIILTGKGKTETKRAPYVFLIQALGASQIEKAVDLKAMADIIAQDRYDWAFVDDKDLSMAKEMMKNLNQKNRRGRKSEGPTCQLAGNEHIIQSLILGRLYDP